jgi:hypothetical protein
LQIIVHGSIEERNHTIIRAVPPDGGGLGYTGADALPRPSQRVNRIIHRLKSKMFGSLSARAGSNIPAGVITLIANKEYRVTKPEIRRKVCGILLTNSEIGQARQG